MPGKTERKIFTELRGPGAGELNEPLGRIGFRRSQNVASRPSRDNCHGCVSIRVITDSFEPNATTRRLLQPKSNLRITACQPSTNEQQLALIMRQPDPNTPARGKNARE